MSAPLLSILIPVYNAAAVLDQTLDSALAEAASVDAEVIALDDGSSDHSLAVLRRRGAAVQVVTQANQGVSVARNRLAAMARGAWLLFLDADDLLLPGTLAQRLAVAEASHADAIYCDWQRFGQTAQGRVWGERVTRALADVHADPVLALFSGFWSPPGAWLFQRALHERIGGFRLDLPIIQDARYALDAALVGARFAHAEHLGCAYREGQSQSLSQRSAERFADDCLRHAEQIEQVFCARGRHGAEERRALADTFEYAARVLAATAPERAALAVRGALRQQLASRSRWLSTATWCARCLGERRGLVLTAALAAWAQAPRGPR